LGALTPQTVELLPIFEGEKTFEDRKEHLLQEYCSNGAQDNCHLLNQTQESLETQEFS